MRRFKKDKKCIERLENPIPEQFLVEGDIFKPSYCKKKLSEMKNIFKVRLKMLTLKKIIKNYKITVSKLVCYEYKTCLMSKNTKTKKV